MSGPPTRIQVSDEDRIAFIAHADEIAKAWKAKYGRGIGQRRIYYRLRGVSWSVVQEGGRWPDWVKKNLIDAKKRWLRGDRGPRAIDPRLFSEEGRELVSWRHDESVEDWAASLPRYSPDPWVGQPLRVVVVCEKDGLAGLVESACRPLAARYMCTNGDASIGARLDVKDLLDNWRDHGFDVRLLYVGDHDVTGVRMDRTWVDELNLPPGIFERVAITLPQAEALGLEFETVDPNRPRYAKSGRLDKTWPTKARKYVERFGEPGATTARAIELDMIEEELERLIADAIRQYIDPAIWAERQEETEAPIREVDDLLKQLRGQMP